MKPILFVLLLVGVSRAEDPRFLSHLFGYIGLDYSAAVNRSGKIINQGEYAEMVEFADAAVKEAALLPELVPDGEFHSDLTQLKSLILRKAPPEEVAKLSKRLENRVVSACRLQRVPAHWPSLLRGEARYAESCAQCHGATGHGDGPSGQGLDPRPADFHDGERMAKVTPFNLFNAIRLGVPGTGMAAFPYSDDETWELAFYVQSIRHRSKVLAGVESKPFLPLATLAERSDEEILASLDGDSESRNQVLRLNRTYQTTGSRASQFVDIALSRLQDAERAFHEGNWDRAEKYALAAYLDGVELFEANLRSREGAFILELEEKMAEVRTAIAREESRPRFSTALSNARQILERARTLLEHTESSPIMTVLLSGGIVLREALEAVLILIALLGVIRSAGVKVAAVSVHLGWMSALAVGLGLWFFSGWVMHLSGLQRELLEGFVTVLAVAVLLYFGFWLHRKTEIGRWRNFLSQIALQLADGKKLFGLFGVAFMAVFREAFETVLFLRALSLESGGGSPHWIGFGVVGALATAALLAAVGLKMSRKIPIRELFLISSSLLVFLSITLMGKGIHAFQEAGFIAANSFPINVRFDLFGIYPTWETLIPQFLIVVLGLVVWLNDRLRAVSRAQLPQN